MIIALDKYKRPLGFLTERRCRILMERKRAVLYRVFPTVVILMDVDARTIPDLPSFRIKIDPGSKYTGIAIIRNDTDEFVYAMQIEHRGDAVRAALNKRKNARRNRRSRETGYRRAKWGNRCLSEKDKRSYGSSREDGWLPPSIRSAADNVISWVRRLGRWINLTECSFEAVRFDTQLMEDPDIEGEKYQHGTLFGLEIKEYLMEKFGHTCQYCSGKSGDPVLEWEHMRPKSRGGSDRVKNALLSCSSCNKDKGNRTPEEWLELIKARLTREKGKRKELDEERVELIQKVIDGNPREVPCGMQHGYLLPDGTWKRHCLGSSGMWSAPAAAGQNITAPNLGIQRNTITMLSVSAPSRRKDIMTGRTDTTCMPRLPDGVPDSGATLINVG